MTDWLKVWLLIIAVAGWLIGGTVWKPARRFVYPLIAAFILHLHGIDAWRIGAVYLSLVLANSLPYGDGSRAWRRGLVFVALAAPSLWLSWHLWWLRLLLTGGGCSLMFWLSRRFGKVDHKVFESYAGFAQASTLIIAA